MKTKSKVSVGMIDPPELQTIEEVESTRYFQKFKAQTVAEYEVLLSKMDDSDLRHHASAVGLRPGIQRRPLILNLIDKFKTAKAKVETLKSFKAVPVGQRPVGRFESYESFMSQFK